METKRMHVAEHVDLQFQRYLRTLLTVGKTIPGRTGTRRISIRHIENAVFTYDLGQDGNELPVSSLRKVNPKMPIAETLFYITGSDSLRDMGKFNPTLARIWAQWSSDDGKLGGVYGPTFRGQAPSDNYTDQLGRVVKYLTNDKTKWGTHARMTTLLPDQFPKPGNTYHKNVSNGRFALMPCMHTYQFLLTHDGLDLRITQASGDAVIGVVPHNVIQGAMMLKIVSMLVGVKPRNVTHTINDLHYYENQEEQVHELANRAILMENRPFIKTPPLHELPKWVDVVNSMVEFYKQVEVGGCTQHPALGIPVDS